MLKLSRNEALIISLFLIGIITLAVGDIIDDLSHGSSLSHTMTEILVIVLNIGCFLYIWIKYFKTKKENRKIKLDLTQVQNDLLEYKKETQHLLKGLSEKIDSQLEKWKLTKSEKEIALLLLKGLTTKEISALRQTSESTIKQQCNSIYQKSNLSGRNELSAFFLEDLYTL